MSNRNVLAICLLETWRYGNEILENGHYRLITSGLSRNVVNDNCDSQDAAIVLNQEGVIAWKAADSGLVWEPKQGFWFPHSYSITAKRHS